MHRLLNIAVAIGFSAALLAAGLFYRDDLSGRKPSQRYLAQFGLEGRQPEVAGSVGYALSPDWAADLVADAALHDALEGVDLSNVTPEARAAWIESASHMDEELQSARELLLDAIAVRPGWPFHQSLLGQIVLAEQQRDSGEKALESPTRWLRPLRNAAEGAPAVSAVWQSLAAGYLQTWPALERDSALPRILTNAFADPEFVRATFAPIAALIGSEVAVRSLPESPKPLLAAFEYFSKENDIFAAFGLRARWERAEWKERVRDLEAIERHYARGDTDDVRTLCEQWTRLHSVWDFDSPAAHAQAARILERWPGGSAGGWRVDPIAEVARYLWTRNGEGARFAPLIDRVLDTVPRVPRPLLAEVNLAAGEVNEAERLARSADDAGSMKWSRYLLALARNRIASGNLSEAEEALRRLPAAEGQTHEALLTRGELAAARGDSSGSATLLAGAVERSGLSSCAAEAKFPIHGWRGWQTVRVRFSAAAPAVIDLGANDARSGTLLIAGDRMVTFRFYGFADQTLWFKRLSGGEICARVDRSI